MNLKAEIKFSVQTKNAGTAAPIYEPYEWQKTVRMAIFTHGSEFSNLEMSD